MKYDMIQRVMIMAIITGLCLWPTLSQAQETRVWTEQLYQLRPHEQTTPNATVRVDKGIASVASNAKIEYAGGNSGAFSVVNVADPAESRIDLLVMNSSGNLEIIAGTQAESPAVPTYPLDKLVIAEVTIDETATVVIEDSDIKDVRFFLNIGSPGTSTATDNAYVDVTGDTMTGTLTFSGAATDIATATDEHLALMPNGAGNVGIGTTGPGGRLEIVASSGNSYVYLDGPESSQQGIHLQDNNVAKWSIYNDGADSHKLKFYDDGDTRMTIQQDGNVGIGTTSPSQKLHVAGNSYFSGNVGIGTTNPEEPLHTVGTSWFTGKMDIGSAQTTSGLNTVLSVIKTTTGNIFEYTDNLNDNWVMANPSDGVVSIGPTTATNMYFVTSNSPRMAIASGGNVGIGITNPGYKLDVQGGETRLGGDTRLGAPTIGHASGSPDIFIQGNLEVDATAYMDGGLIVASDVDIDGTGNSDFAGNVLVTGSLKVGAAASGNKFAVADTGATLLGDTIAGFHADTLAAGKSIVWISTDDAVATDEYFLLLRSDEDGTPDAEYSFRTDGVAATDGSWGAGGADYAEWFEKEGIISEGALVGLNIQTGKVRVWQEGDPFIGVQSLDPGFVGNIAGTLTTEQEMQEDYALVALIGQVEIRSDDIIEENKTVFTKNRQFIGWRLSTNKVFLK